MTLRVYKAKHQTEGGCNFCNEPHTVVYVVKGNDKTLVVRFCRRCLNLLEKAKYL